MSVTFRRLGRAAGVVAVSALLVAAAGCGSDNGGGATASGGSTTKSADNKPVKIAFFGLAAENAYTQAMYQAAESKVKELGGSIKFFDGKFDGATQITQMQDAITSGQYDAFMVMPNDQAGAVPVTKQAIAAGIKVAALQFPIGPDPTNAKPQVEGVTTSVIEDVVRGAEVTAESINAMCVDRDPCETAILWGSRKVSWDGAAKRKPLMDKLDPNVKIVAEADGGFLQEPGEKATADIIQAHPGLDVLATPSGDQMTLGGERALKAAGKKIGLADRGKDDVAIVGYGAAKSGVQRVADGLWYSTYALVPATMAIKATELLVAGARGEPVESDGLVQTEISPVGDNITKDVLSQHSDWKAEWEG